MNNDTLTLFLATSILAIGGVGLYMFQSDKPRQSGGKNKKVSPSSLFEDDNNEYNDNKYNDNDYSESDNESLHNGNDDDESVNSFYEYDKSYDKKQKSPKTKKTAKSQNKGTKRKY